MCRPKELPDGLDPLQPVAALDQCLGVAREGGGIARDIGDPRHRSPGQDGDLLLGPGTRWIQDDPVESSKLLAVQRAPEEIAVIDEELGLGTVGGSLQCQGRVAGALDGEDPAFQ